MTKKLNGNIDNISTEGRPVLIPFTHPRSPGCPDWRGMGDGRHCECWYDGEGKCCNCGYTGKDEMGSPDVTSNWSCVKGWCDGYGVMWSTEEEVVVCICNPKGEQKWRTKPTH